MLVFTRKENETIILTLDSDIDPSTPIGEVFTQPIQIKVDKIRPKSVVISCDAPMAIKILRGELLE